MKNIYFFHLIFNFIKINSAFDQKELFNLINLITHSKHHSKYFIILVNEIKSLCQIHCHLKFPNHFLLITLLKISKFLATYHFLIKYSQTIITTFFIVNPMNSNLKIVNYRNSHYLKIINFIRIYYFQKIILNLLKLRNPPQLHHFMTLSTIIKFHLILFLYTCYLITYMLYHYIYFNPNYKLSFLLLIDFLCLIFKDLFSMDLTIIYIIYLPINFKFRKNY